MSITVNSSPPSRDTSPVGFWRVGSPDVVAEPHALVHALRDLAQQLVSRGVAERVVHLLEAVEVEEEQGQALVAAFRGDQRAPQPILEPLPVRQAREPVVERQVADAFLGLLALGDLADQRCIHLAELAGAPLDFPLQAFPVTRERVIAFLDLLEHLVERLDQHAHLVATIADRARREVLVGRDALRRLDQLQDRIRDEALELRRERQAGQTREQHHQAEDPAVAREPLVQVDRPGADHDRPERVSFCRDR